MAAYTVWVSSGEGQPRVTLLESESRDDAQTLVNGLLASSGSSSYDLGVSIVGMGPTPPAPMMATAKTSAGTSETGPAASAPPAAKPATATHATRR